MGPEVSAFFHSGTFTISYVVKDPASNHCAIIDPVLDFDVKSGRTSTSSADKIKNHVGDNDLIVDWILETHAHADHLTAAPYLKEALGGRVGIGDQIAVVQKTFLRVFNTDAFFRADGSQFDHLLFGDGEEFAIGELNGYTIHTPGHTPACITYVVGAAAFVGDTLFMPDYGTARCDFPGGDAATLYHSIHKILALPPATTLYMCHDYGGPGREAYVWETSVAEERAENVHIHDGISEEEFVTMWMARDKTLEMPALILPSVQVNIRAGHLPPPESNGVHYLKIPINAI